MKSKNTIPKEVRRFYWSPGDITVDKPKNTIPKEVRRFYWSPGDITVDKASEGKNNAVVFSDSLK